MTATVAHITQEIRHLAPDEARELWRELQQNFPQAATAPSESEAEVEASWKAEITMRIEDIQKGRVNLISADEATQHITALFARHGLKRRAA